MGSTTVFKTELGDFELITEKAKPRHSAKAARPVQRYRADFTISDELLATMRTLGSSIVGIKTIERSSAVRGASFTVIFDDNLKGRDSAITQTGHDFASRLRRWINTGSLKSPEDVYREASSAMAVHSTVRPFGSNE